MPRIYRYVISVVTLMAPIEWRNHRSSPKRHTDLYNSLGQWNAIAASRRYHEGYN